MKVGMLVKTSHFWEWGIGFINHDQEGYFNISSYDKVSHLLY